MTFYAMSCFFCVVLTYNFTCQILEKITHKKQIQVPCCLIEGYAYLNFCYADNAHYILSCLLHLLVRTEIVPFPRNLSLQFDNATNNKCNEEIGLFAHLVSEVCERFLFYVRISYFTTTFCLSPPPPIL